MMIRPTRGSVKVSEEFMRAFDSLCNGCVRICHCGRTHFDNEGHWDWSKGELEDLIANANKDPDLYIGHPYGVGCYIVDDKEYVHDCPCQGGAQFERFIIRHAHAIANFLNARAKGLEVEAAATKVKLPSEPE
jgi:hypothetical protein